MHAISYRQGHLGDSHELIASLNLLVDKGLGGSNKHYLALQKYSMQLGMGKPMCDCMTACVACSI